MNCGPEELSQGMKESYDAADMALTGTICEIYKDKVVLTRYDTDGKHCLGADGCGDPYKGGIDADLISETHYSKAKESPQTVKRRQ